MQFEMNPPAELLLSKDAESETIAPVHVVVPLSYGEKDFHTFYCLQQALDGSRTDWRKIIRCQNGNRKGRGD